jgi:hypothetical protein
MDILVAILAKDKAPCLPRYLECLLNQTFPKNKTHLYIRTNDNNDNTEEILKEFISKNTYASVFFDSSSISEELKQFGHHEWNVKRFKILGKIRQDSIEYAKTRNLDYFVADLDNYIIPTTLERMSMVRALGVVSPMLVSKTYYANYHADVDNNGYLKECTLYRDILFKKTVGLIKVPVVHCTYFIANDCLKYVCYDDNTNRYEYVIFSDSLRKSNINQYIDNRIFYGFVTFSTSTPEIEKEFESWAPRFAPLSE